ncbi:MAG: dethiobiotin synthase [Acidobacteria bacterium]|nr:dethiobiotin synthase [Acidobacteriota bacterium]
MRPQGILITGTDTGVGKTFVACGLTAALRRRGMRIVPFKPAESGCELDPKTGQLLPSDAMLLRQAAGTEAPLEAICPYRFRLPVAPWVAAQEQDRTDEEEGKGIDPSFLAWQFQELASTHDLVIAETAGGILVPLGERFHFGDLARLLDLPVLVVAASKLGVINHTLLTLEYLRSSGLKSLGVVLNHPLEDPSPAVQTNAATLRKLANTRVFVLPRSPAGYPNPDEPTFQEMASHILTLLST